MKKKIELEAEAIFNRPTPIKHLRKDPIGVLTIRDVENLRGKDHIKISKFLKELAEVTTISQGPINDALDHALGH